MNVIERLEVQNLSKQIGNTIDRQTLLRFTEMRKAFGGQTVLDGVTGELRQGEVVLLQGANGSGKTTLLNALTGNLEPDSGRIELLCAAGKSESFSFPVSWWQGLNPLTRFAPEQLARLGVGRTWQDIRLFSTQTLLDNIAVAAPEQLGENPAWVLLRRSAVFQQENRNCRDASTQLAQLGLGGREKSSADKISLGQSKRVAILRAVQAGAKILFLDEPLAGLDASGIAEVMELLTQLVHQNQVTLVIIEHIFNIPRILELATMVWTLEQGKLTVESVKKILNPKSQIPNSIEGLLQDLVGVGGKIKEQVLPGGARLSILQPEGGIQNEIALEVEELVVYRGKRLVIGERREDGQVKGLSFTLNRGEVGVLQAPNGWGKTTLLEAISGLSPIRSGLIRVGGKPIQDLPTWERVNLGLSLLQARDNVFPSLTVREVLKLTQVKHISENIRDLLAKRMSDLSGGEKQKIVIFSTLQKKDFKIAILDEPFSALDPNAVNDIQSLISNILNKIALLVAVPIGIQR
jgi:ABC-type branched-subunit amino acid transport system ATPase component